MTSPAHGLVAAGHKETAKAAADILADGGNAFDAILAGLMMSCVAEPVFASLGGGAHLVARKAGAEKAIIYDFFAHTPKVKRPSNEIDFHAIHAEFGPASQEFHIGVGATATPGIIPGLFEIHSDLATIPMAHLAEASVNAAKQGVQITSLQAYLFQVAGAILTASEQSKSLFAPNGDILIEGEIYRNPDLSQTIEQLAREGVEFFTKGEAAKAIIKQADEQGGHITLNDLQSYKVEKRQPLNWNYRGAELMLNPAPAASGALIAFGLWFLEQITQTPTLQDLFATMQATNEVRKRYNLDLGTILKTEILNNELQALKGHKAATRGTTHISVIDKNGNAAAATITNGEGNGRIVDGLGLIMNNMLGEEDLNPTGFHTWQPDTRLSTMMAPTLMKQPDGTLTALGSGGSNRIRTAILQVIVNLLDHGVSLKEAVNAPRMHLEKCGTLSFEDLFSEEDQDELLAQCPNAKNWPERNLFFGGVHAVSHHPDGTFEGAGDPRRDGCVIAI